MTPTDPNALTPAQAQFANTEARRILLNSGKIESMEIIRNGDVIKVPQLTEVTALGDWVQSRIPKPITRSDTFHCTNPKCRKQIPPGRAGRQCKKCREQAQLQSD